jgi:hypothetical protein
MHLSSIPERSSSPLHPVVQQAFPPIDPTIQEVSYPPMYLQWSLERFSSPLNQTVVQQPVPIQEPSQLLSRNPTLPPYTSIYPELVSHQPRRQGFSPSLHTSDVTEPGLSPPTPTPALPDTASLYSFNPESGSTTDATIVDAPRPESIFSRTEQGFRSKSWISGWKRSSNAKPSRAKPPRFLPLIRENPQAEGGTLDDLVDYLTRSPTGKSLL